jgi:hypothetical protein
VSWGKHVYTQPNEIKSRSNDVELVRVSAQ